MPTMTRQDATWTPDDNPSAQRSEARRMSRHPSLRLCQSLFCLFVVALPVAHSRADLAPPPPPPAAAAVAAPAAAAPVAAPAAKATTPDSEGYVPENRPATMANVEEGIPAGPLVAAAYGFIWLAVLVFVGLTARRTSQLEREIAELAERLGAKSGSAS